MKWFHEHEQKIYTYLLSLFFIPLSLMVFTGAYHFIGDLLDFSHFVYFLPVYIGYILLPMILEVGFYYLARPHQEKGFRTSSLVLGILLSFFGLLLVALTSGYIASSYYYSPVMGTVNAIFPIDLIIYGILAICFGIPLILRSLLDKKPLENWKFYPRSKKSWAIFPFALFYLLIAFYMLGGFLLGFDYANWEEASFGLMIPTYLIMLFIPGLLDAYVIIYQNISISSLSGWKKFYVLWSPLGFAIILNLLLLVTNLIDPNVYVHCGKPYFPIDFEGSLNVAPLVLSAFSFIGAIAVPLLALKKKEA